MKTKKLALLVATAILMVGCAADTDDGVESDNDGHDGTDDGADPGDVGNGGEEDVGTTTAAIFSGRCPAKGRLSQGFKGRTHDGIDIANVRGTNIYAVGPGTVTASGTASGYGQWIRIRHTDGSMTEYGHMYQRLVAVGATVQAGQLIARMGSEGRSSGPHLHLRTYASATRVGAGNGMNPITYLSARGVRIPC